MNEPGTPALGPGVGLSAVGCPSRRICTELTPTSSRPATVTSTSWVSGTSVPSCGVTSATDGALVSALTNALMVESPCCPAESTASASMVSACPEAETGTCQATG